MIAPAATVRTVLIVDDFPAVLAWATRAFERDGWNVLTAANGTEALSICRDQQEAGRPIALLVTDLDLPEFDGVYLVKSMRAVERDVPVVALSANATIAREWSGEMLDRTVFFAKPVRASLLVAAANGLVTPSVDPLDSFSPSG
ncbi:response regulator [Gemmatimonas groenlandica]|uniref:Response regulator n=1 Tax=Gemmatimonas groenlandica TaxID=2732249 RepID=A0A6M4IVN1_9BACT|nr:response regulator [Gemmatimonas groenlandica]QJR37667.1 response regulator [Gemmatimonas groenlandica]